MFGSLSIAVVVCLTVAALIGFGLVAFGFSSKEREKVRYALAIFGALIVATCIVRLLFVDLSQQLEPAKPSLAAIRTSVTSSDILGLGMLLATLVLVGVTTWYAWSNHRYVVLLRRQLQLQTDPQVIIYTQPREASQNAEVVRIVIANIGKGIAKDVSFSAGRDENSQQSWDGFINARGTSTPLSGTPLAHGIPILPPNGMVVIPWDPQGFRLQDSPLRILCHCKRLGEGPETEVKPVECILEALPQNTIDRHNLSCS